MLRRALCISLLLRAPCGLSGFVLLAWTQSEGLSTTLTMLLLGMCRDQNLHFVEQVALAPPEVQIDVAQQAAYEQQLQTAMAQPLPDEDEELAE